MQVVYCLDMSVSLAASSAVLVARNNAEAAAILQWIDVIFASPSTLKVQLASMRVPKSYFCWIQLDVTAKLLAAERTFI
jgi:hypothetical protein